MGHQTDERADGTLSAGDIASERVSDARARTSRRRSAAATADPNAPSIDRPAHPLPTTRSSSLDYDRYLERSTDKFKIFSASERRARRKHVIAACACVVVLAIAIIWAALSRLA